MAEAIDPYASPASQLAAGHKRCDTCGAEILAQAEICPKCGVRQRAAVSKTALLLLTFFTGGMGGHKFYLKKYWQGALYLLFFWTYIPGVIALVELIVYACTSSERLNQKYSANSAAVIAVIMVFFGIFLLGILAAIAIPAYQDYTHRARVSEVLIASVPWKLAVSEYYEKTRKLPRTGGELERPALAQDGGSRSGSVNPGPNGILILTMLAPGATAGKTILLRPDVSSGAIRWDCTAGTLEPRYRPRECRPQ